MDFTSLTSVFRSIGGARLLITFFIALVVAQAQIQTAPNANGSVFRQHVNDKFSFIKQAIPDPPTLGAEQFNSPTFSPNSAWGTEGTFVTTTGSATYTDSSTSQRATLYQSNAAGDHPLASNLALNAIYQFEYTVSAVSATPPERCEAGLDGPGNVTLFPDLSVGTHIFYLNNTSMDGTRPTDMWVSLNCYSAGTGSGQTITFTEMSLKPVTSTIPNTVSYGILNYDLPVYFSGSPTVFQNLLTVTPAGWIQFEGAKASATNYANYTVMQMPTNEVGAAPFGMGVVLNPPISPATKQDNVWYYGYNCGLSGGKYVSSQHKLCWVMETDWTTGTGVRQMEFSLTYSNPSGTLNAHPINVLPHINSDEIEVYNDATVYAVRTLTGSADKFRVNTVTGDTTITGLAGTGNAFACLDSNGTLYRSATACTP
jgi:hypothetical protein